VRFDRPGFPARGVKKWEEMVAHQNLFEVYVVRTRRMVHGTWEMKHSHEQGVGQVVKRKPIGDAEKKKEKPKEIPKAPVKGAGGKETLPAPILTRL